MPRTQSADKLQDGALSRSRRLASPTWTLYNPNYNIDWDVDSSVYSRRNHFTEMNHTRCHGLDWLTAMSDLRDRARVSGHSDSSITATHSFNKTGAPRRVSVRVGSLRRYAAIKLLNCERCVPQMSVVRHTCHVLYAPQLFNLGRSQPLNCSGETAADRNVLCNLGMWNSVESDRLRTSRNS